MSVVNDSKHRFDVTALPRNMREKILPSETNSFNGSQCWEWVGALNSRGYGSMTNGRGSSMLTHRKAYEVVVGKIPYGLTIDHLCFNKPCVNTDHLEAVTRAENTRRATARQTHCAQGHLLSGDNMRIKRRKNGWVQRVCKTCQNKWVRVWRAKQKDAEPMTT